MSSDKNIAGEKYSLTCTVMFNGSSDVPNISWNTSLLDKTVSNGSGIYSSVLYFEPLLFSHEGTYMCQVEVADITDVQTYHLKVIGKQSSACSYMHCKNLI